MSTLYELTSDFLAVVDMAQDPDIDEQMIADTLEGIEGEIEIKADGYAKVLAELSAMTETLKTEINRLQARKKTIDANADRIKHVLEDAMRATGKTKFKTDLFSFNIQKNPASVKIIPDVDIDSVPAEFIIWPEPAIDKKKVKDAIKNGEEFEWAWMEQTEGLRIR